MDGPAVSAWFLTPVERGNPATRVDERHAGRAWTHGNRVEAIVHGRVYFERLHRELCRLEEGDAVSFLDWRADPDETLVDGVRVAEALAELAERGVRVRGLVWRSHPEHAGFQLESHQELAEHVNRAGGSVLLDHRVRRVGSHHQKLFVLLHPGSGREDVAFVGGIDLCHGRRDDDTHLGDTQPEEMDERYSSTPPWHDVQVEVRGPAVADLVMCFAERWNDPTPLDDRRTPWRAVLSRLSREPDRRDEHPDPPDQRPVGDHLVQVLRTYPSKSPSFPFAPRGERSVVRAYRKAFERARSLIYVEDQYLWSTEVADLLVGALERAPTLRVLVVVPRVPDRNGPVSGPPHRIAQQQLLERVSAAGGERFAAYDLENDAGTPIYVHAKVVIVDDVWAAVGSDNLNRRSWTHDSELSCAILDPTLDDREPRDPAGLGDGARVFARDLRLRLMREHLGLDEVTGLVDHAGAFEAFHRSAGDLAAWHEGGETGPRPRGRVMEHHLEPVTWWERPWAKPLYRLLVDPDGRPRDLKRARVF